MNLDAPREQVRARRLKPSTVLFGLTAGALLLLAAVASWAAMGYASPDGQSSSGIGRGALSKSSSSLGYLQGAQAPDFTYTLLDGTQVTLSSFRGKPVVLNFWASWCPPCRAEAPTLEKVWEAYRGKGVQFLGVDIQDSEQGAQAFLKEFGITYPNGQDTSNGIAASYGITGIPETFFIARDGKITRHWIGPIEERQLSGLIEELLQ